MLAILASIDFLMETACLKFRDPCVAFYPGPFFKPFTCKMASATFATKENLAFIEEVQKYDCVYNKYSRDFKNKFKKYNCWVQIATKFDISPEEAEKKFRNVRTAYGRFLKKRKGIPSGSGRDAVPEIPKEFANLEWLSTLISHRKTTSNFQPTAGAPGDDAVETDSAESFSDSETLDSVQGADVREREEPDNEKVDHQTAFEETEVEISSNSCSKQSGDFDDQRKQPAEKTTIKRKGTTIRSGKQGSIKRNCIGSIKSFSGKIFGQQSLYVSNTGCDLMNLKKKNDGY